MGNNERETFVKKDHYLSYNDKGDAYYESFLDVD